MLILFLLFCCKRVPWIVECIPAVVLGAIGIPLTQKYGAVHFWFPPVYWFLALGLWFFLIYRLYPRAYRVASINSWMRRVMRRKNAAGVDARDYWLAGSLDWVGQKRAGTARYRYGYCLWRSAP